MRYLSVCSGIEAATVAWHPLGWQPVAFSEIDKFPCAVLKHHYPTVPNWGDMTKFQEWPDADVDVLVGGTPCQSFSVAGLRAGLADPRGNLALTYLAILDRYRPRWCCWENVPGVLSSGGGRDFGAFLGGLGELGYGWAYRVLDAQYFGLAQRRARVFVVGHLGDWRRAAAVLFERESLSGHPAPRREAGEGTTAGTLRSTDGGLDCDHAAAGHVVADTAPTLGQRMRGPIDSMYDGALIASTGERARALTTSCQRIDAETETLVVHSLRADGFDASEDGTGRGTPLVPIAFTAKDHGADAGDLAPTLRAGGFTGSHANGGVMPAIAFDTTQITSAANYSNPKPGDPCHPLASGAHAPAVALAIRGRDGTPQIEEGGEVANAVLTPNGGRGGIGVGAVRHGMQVRRLTPRECERLQGFPDDYTLIPYRGKLAADGPRYKALGNSMAVPVMRWIGQRVALVNVLTRALEQTA